MTGKYSHWKAHDKASFISNLVEMDYTANRKGIGEYAQKLHVKHPQFFKKRLNASELEQTMNQTYLGPRPFYTNYYCGVKKSAVNICKFLNVKCSVGMKDWNAPSKKNKLVEYNISMSFSLIFVKKSI